MSWGERSCAQGHPCGFNPTPSTCNVQCRGYRWDGFTTPDSGDALRLTKTQLRLLAQAEHDKEAKHEND